jgi:hypothetical protein
MRLDLTRIGGEQKRVWWMDAATGAMKYLGQFPSQVLLFRPHEVRDGVLIAINATKDYLQP